MCSYFREYLNSYFIPTDRLSVFFFSFTLFDADVLCCVLFFFSFCFFFLSFKHGVLFPVLHSTFNSPIIYSNTDLISVGFFRCTQRNLRFSIFRHSLQLEIPNRVFRLRCIKLGFELLCILIDRHAC